MSPEIRAGLALLLIALVLYVAGGENTGRDLATGAAFFGVVLLVLGLVRPSKPQSDESS